MNRRLKLGSGLACHYNLIELPTWHYESYMIINHFTPCMTGLYTGHVQHVQLYNRSWHKGTIYPVVPADRPAVLCRSTPTLPAVPCTRYAKHFSWPFIRFVSCCRSNRTGLSSTVLLSLVRMSMQRHTLRMQRALLFLRSTKRKGRFVT